MFGIWLAAGEIPKKRIITGGTDKTTSLLG
jgi:hypothetical protein